MSTTFQRGDLLVYTQHSAKGSREFVAEFMQASVHQPEHSLILVHENEISRRRVTVRDSDIRAADPKG